VRPDLRLVARESNTTAETLGGRAHLTAPAINQLAWASGSSVSHTGGVEVVPGLLRQGHDLFQLLHREVTRVLRFCLESM